MKQQIVIPREVLLIEIERRCADPRCNARNRIGLTKNEARTYHGFECEKCQAWIQDALLERDIPDWWEELRVTGLDMLRGNQAEPGADDAEVVIRMSDAYRRAQPR